MSSKLSAICSQSFFRGQRDKGSTESLYGGKVTRGGLYEATGEVTRGDCTSAPGLLVGVLAAIYSLFDTVLVVISVVAIFLALTQVLVWEPVVGGFTTVVYHFGVLLFQAIYELQSQLQSACSIAHQLVCEILCESMTLVKLAGICLGRFSALIWFKLLNTRFGRGKLRFVPTSLYFVGVVVFSTLFGAGDHLIVSSLLFFQVKFTESFEAKYVGLLGIGLFVFRPIFVLLGLAANFVFQQSLSGFNIRRARIAGEKDVKYPGADKAPESRLDKRSRSAVAAVSRCTGLFAPKMFRFATVDQWNSFGNLGIPDDMSHTLRGLALVGDREMSSALARASLYQGLDVQVTSDLSQRLLTNSAFAKYFDTRLVQLYPAMKHASEKRKGTFVEAVVGAASLESGGIGSVEQFVMIELRKVIGV